MTLAVTNRARGLADRIFNNILSGEFVFGSRLPTERDFAQDNDVPRSTVRQALSLLEHYDVIERRQGSGSFVRYKTPEPASDDSNDPGILQLAELADTTSPLELGVLRSIVEPEIIRLAVLNMTSRNISQMNALMQEMEQITVDGVAFAECDNRLRLHLATCTNNPLLLAAYKIVLYAAANANWAKLRHQSSAPGQIRTAIARNKALCGSIEKRDIDAAVEHTKLALAAFHQDLVRPG
ncbi:FadR/GntR family transcriptional regulator [Coralliovum pocilloporae]|uniref:FadR/GntR family transcriptional regulator n=1 Tax=Coralliovum pocilloporae TaxID=3066369 RepID=UPI00330712A6